MAFLYRSGFELNSVTDNIEQGNNQNALIQTSVVRSGTYAQQVTSLASGAGRGAAHNYLTSTTTSPTYARFYLNVATRPSGNNRIFNFNTTVSVAASTVPGVNLTSAGALQLMVNNAQVGSDSSVLALNTWYRVEIMFDGTPGSGSRIAELRLEGSTVALTSTATNALTARSFVCGGNLNNEAQTTGNWYFDDVGVNDATGSNQTSWLGDGKIVHLRPDGAGDNAADLGTFADIDEVTPNDATDFIDLDTGTSIADYTVASSASAGIGSSDTISFVSVGVRIREESSLVTSYRLRIKSASGGTTSTSSTSDVGSTVWRTNPSGSSDFRHLLVSYTDPTTGVAWTPTGTNSLDNMQIGVASTTTNDLDVSTLWALVEYVPNAGGGSAVKDLIGGYIPHAR